VRKLGAADSVLRTPDRGDEARLFNVLLAVAVWNSAVQQMSALRGASITDTARVLALMNVAISDALVTVMETKYHYAFWRPETAIPAAGSDGNSRTHPDPAFVPFIPTPCFPSYPSAHASASYAARSVLDRVWGDRDVSVTLTHPSLPNVIRHYTTYKKITLDIDDARVYGGIHFRFDQDAGATQGSLIGAYVVEHLLRKRE
jgi:hypothetical protein